MGPSRDPHLHQLADPSAEIALGSRKEIAEARARDKATPAPAAPQHGNSGLQAGERTSADKQYYLFAAKSGQRYLVRTAVPFTVKTHELLAADYVFLWFMTALTLVMCFIAYFSTRRLGKHIERLNNFAEKVEQGERIVDTEPFPNDELGSISNHIVYLYASCSRPSRSATTSTARRCTSNWRRTASSDSSPTTSTMS
jgi:HAMP domain-containing protein